MKKWSLGPFFYVKNMKVSMKHESIIKKEMKVSSMKILQIDYNKKMDYDLNMQRKAGKLARKTTCRKNKPECRIMKKR